MADAGDPLRDALAMVAPGTPLREGLDRILQGNRGALIVVSDDPAVLSICTGGFLMDAEFTPQRLSELAKMDGAIILTADASRIARTNVHLMPRASIPTTETGTRHRTAERVARCIDAPVVSVSEAMATITVYRGAERHALRHTGRLIARATQAIAAVERFKSRYDLALALLSTLEVEDSVSVGDVVSVLQPGEMVVRFTEEVQDYLVELGEDGRLIRLQIDELGAGVEEALRLVALDYVVLSKEAPVGDGAVGDGASTDGAFGGGAAREGALGDSAASDGAFDDRPRRAASTTGPDARRERRADEAVAALHALSHDELTGRLAVAAALGFEPTPAGLDEAAEARGFRLLHRLPRLSDAIIDRIVQRFGTLPRLMQASPADLEQVGGVGEAKARSVKDGLARMVEASILERYE
ncbi:MAG: DNA integrity scanning diadenylate cyclase DisA [Acidimicrobiales bacterium]